MRACLFPFLLILSATFMTAQATTHLVLPDGSGDLPTIEAAIAVSAWSDTIALGDGVFTGDGNRDLRYSGKPIVICSQSGDPASCVINCEGTDTDPHRAFVFDWGESAGSVLCGVTIVGGQANGASPPETLESCGGGVLITNYSNPTLIDVVFEDCTAWIGGALCIWEGSPRLEGCKFLNNLAWWGSGGGIWCSYGSPTLTDCRFVENRSNQAGAAMSCRHAPDLSFTRCWFEGNSIEAGFGGAIDVYIGAQAAFDQCTFVGNSIDDWGWGGAVFCGFSDSSAGFEGCTFYANAAQYGGGIASRRAKSRFRTRSSLSAPTVRRSTAKEPPAPPSPAATSTETRAATGSAVSRPSLGSAGTSISIRSSASRRKAISPSKTLPPALRNGIPSAVSSARGRWAAATAMHPPWTLCRCARASSARPGRTRRWARCRFSTPWHPMNGRPSFVSSISVAA